MDLDTEDNLIELMIEFLDFKRSVNLSTAASTPCRVSRGKPAGAKGQWAMHDFVAHLWAGSRYFGEVTLSSRGGQAGGSIVALLNALKPMLPKAFFPGILNYSFLRNVQKSLPPDSVECESLFEINSYITLSNPVAFRVSSIRKRTRHG